MIDGKEMASDGSYIPAEVSRNSWIDIEVKVELSMLSYLDDLDQEPALPWNEEQQKTHSGKTKLYNAGIWQ